MNKGKSILCLSAVLIASLTLTGCGKTAELKVGKETAVAVKGGKITANNLYNELKKDSVEKLVNMIDHKLFDKKYPTDDNETKSIDKQIEQIKSYYKDDEDSYLSAIKTYFGVESEDELKETLSLEYKRGLAVNDYLEDNISDDEVQKYYDNNIFGDVKASHILISVNTTDKMSDDEKNKVKEKALNKAKKVIKELDSGKDFSELAKKYSDDSATASKGGNLGYFNDGEMDANFWNAAKNLEKGKYTTEPVESSYGYHIILKTGEKKKKSLKSAKAEIKKTLAKEKLNNDKSMYYETLKAIREDKKITFGDKELEKLYNDYMDKLIKDAKSNSNTNTTN